MEEDLPLGKRDIDPLILRALVRTLCAKGILSGEDVRALLLEAAEGLDIEGGAITRQAASDIVSEDLLRPFLEDEKRDELD